MTQKKRETKGKTDKWFTLIKWNMYSKGNNTQSERTDYRIKYI